MGVGVSNKHPQVLFRLPIAPNNINAPNFLSTLHFTRLTPVSPASLSRTPTFRTGFIILLNAVSHPAAQETKGVQ